VKYKKGGGTNMQWFSNIRTSAKLSLSFSVVIFLLITVMIASYGSILFLEKNNENLYKNEFSLLENFLKLESNEGKTRSMLLSMLLSSDRLAQEKWHQEIKAITTDTESILQEIATFQLEDKKFTEKLNALKSIHSEFAKTRDEQTIPLIYANKMDEAKNVAMGPQVERYKELYTITHELVSDVREKANDALIRAEQEVTKVTAFFVLIGILALILVASLVLILNRLIANPLKEISAAARQIALGNLDAVQFKSAGRKDEVGILADTFSGMAYWLKNISGTATRIATGDLTTDVNLQSEKDVLGNAFKSMVNNLRQLTSELTEAINSLGSSSSEISTATSELASTASETATSVSETTSTIEEVRQTSQVANQKAKAVSEASQRSAEISQSGKKAADEINEMINQIHNQMELIGESMVRLSEQSQAIGDIIATVDDLAQQSNLLSVNASIEAAKAGEQGKGFAVVAQEVKSLANQSKQATNQVRIILSDIQKATSAAVMATEQGSKAVEAGVLKSTQTGESILKLVDSVTDASHAATQIAATSHQQLIGMEQAALAMENIKQASSQNVESAKQLEIAASNIKGLGVNLKELVGRFKIKTGTDLR